MTKPLMDILDFGWPSSSWRLAEPKTYAQLEWLDPNVAKPTEEEIAEKSDEMSALDYREQRRLAYPPIGDGLDAQVHKENGDDGPWEAYVAACNAVKERFPKPQ